MVDESKSKPEGGEELLDDATFELPSEPESKGEETDGKGEKGQSKFKSVKELEDKLTQERNLRLQAESRSRELEEVTQRETRRLEQERSRQHHEDAQAKQNKRLDRLKEIHGEETASIIADEIRERAAEAASQIVQQNVSPFMENYYRNEVNRQVGDMKTQYGDEFEKLRPMAKQLLETKPGLSMQDAFELAEMKLSKVGKSEDEEIIVRRKRTDAFDGGGGEPPAAKDRSRDKAQNEFDSMMKVGMNDQSRKAAAALGIT